MQTDFRGRRGHHLGEAGSPERRHRIVAFPRTLEDIPAPVQSSIDVARFTRDSNFTLHVVVIRLEFLVAERPILDRRAFRNSRSAISPFRLTDDFEVPGIDPPTLSPVM